MMNECMGEKMQTACLILKEKMVVFWVAQFGPGAEISTVTNWHIQGVGMGSN